MSHIYKTFGNLLVPSSVDTTRIHNHEGFPAFQRSLEERYLQMLMTNTFGNTFYQTKDELVIEASKLHFEMLSKDPEFMAKSLVYARNKGYMRSNPIYGLSVLSPCHPPFFEKIFDKIILTPNDLRDFMVFIKSFGRGQGGRRIKRIAGNWLGSKLNEYWLIKYGSDGKKGFSLKDLLITLHPKNLEHLFARYLIDDEFTAIMHGFPKLTSFNNLKKAETEEEVINCIKQGQLPHEVISSSLKIPLTKNIWREIAFQMPIFALLKNLATLERHDLLPELNEYVRSKLNNSEILAKSKILPFRFLDAFNATRTSSTQDLLRLGLDMSFDNLEDIEGKTVILLDISGSMRGDNIQKPAVFAFSLLKKMKKEARLIGFNDRAFEIPFSQVDSILTQANGIPTSGGTNSEVGIEVLLRERYKTDNIIMITDEQQNTGSPFFHSLGNYRHRINEHVKTFIINIASTTGSLCPDFKNIFYLYGWSDQILQFISLESKGYGSVIDHIKKDIL